MCLSPQQIAALRYHASMTTDATSAAPIRPGFVARRVERWRGTHHENADDHIAEELPVAMRYNGQAFAVMMATPRDLEDFALGFSLSEGLISSPEQLLSVDVQERREGIDLLMTVPSHTSLALHERGPERLLPGRSGCGLCGTRELEDAIRQPTPVRNTGRIRQAALERALAELQQHQPMNSATGAVHAAAWADAEGSIVLVREDVGRHNALDKLIGAMRRAGIASDTGLLLLTSRASYEMVTKAACAGIGVMAAISAPTALAIELARSTGVCLIGFARPGGCNVYTFPERLHDSA
jgi:FdhD protein